ncbi:MAG: hypothetical protein IBJ11_04280 [Phycisphaerales bacterium]|nr:hypothetical protein [Phycisphaerales bacterium]
MRLAAMLILAARVAIGTAWGGAVMMLGMYFLMSPPGGPSRPFWDRPEPWFGLMAAMWGTWIFMCVVADRVVAVRRRGPADAVQFGTLGASIVALAMGLHAWMNLGG